MLIHEKSCYYCDNHALSPAIEGVIDRLGVSADTWRFIRCESCGSLILSPRPSDEVLASFYPHEYSPTKNAKKHNRLSDLQFRAEYWLCYRWIHRAQARILLRALDRQSGDGLRLLDIGCGNGVFLKEAVSLGFAGVGCDQRDTAVAYVRDVLGLPAFHALAHDVSAHFDPGAFDVISAFHVVEHLPNPSLALARWFTLLKPGGSVVLGVPVIDSLQAGVFGRYWSAVREAPRHLSLPSRQGLCSVLTRAGFHQVKVCNDSLLFNAAAVAHTLIPGCVHAAKPAERSNLARLIHMSYRVAGLVLTYLITLLTVGQSPFLANRSGMCIVVARRPIC